jgi:PAS domain S-box-containing protein
MRLLHLEDSPADAELIERLLRQEWPVCQIQRVSALADYRSALAAGGFDLILSDYTLPGFDGLVALDLARQLAPAVPFIFLSGTLGEERAVEALKRGATDYVIKDRPGRLIPSVRQAFALLDEADRRRRTEEELREHQERFRQITETVAEFIAVLDLAGRRTYANPAFRSLLGDPATLIGRDSFQEIHPEDRARVRATFEETVRTGVGSRSEYRFLLGDGRVRHIESQGSVLRDHAGRVANVLVVSRDITARREAELRLREQASLLDKARDAIVATDLEHRIAYWNPSAERLYGWKAAEVFGRPLEELQLGYDPARFAEARRRLLATGEWRGDFLLHPKAGEPVMVESTWSLVVEDDGRPRSILFIDTDVTEKKKLETQLLRSQRMESIGTLAGGIAHDLNNVLTPILMAIDLLGARTTAAGEREIIAKTRASALHGAALVQQLLAFARGADGERAKVDAGQTIRDLEGLVRQGLPRSIQFAVQLDAELWPLRADVTQFKQVLINLCLNARDAMPAGGRLTLQAQNVVVEAAVARLHPGVHAGPHLCVTVVDTGSGIPAVLLERIFDPFFSTKAAGKGTGLGLSMVAGIVKSHGGFVQVESEVGKGSSFRLYFPALSEPPPAVVHAPPPPVASGQGETILLVDDDPVVRSTMGLLLERVGYRPIVAEGCVSGLAAFARERDAVALVITDMMMPDGSGVELITAMRALDRSLPVVAISGLMATGEFNELLQLTPVVECLSKPMTSEELLGAVGRALRRAPR